MRRYALSTALLLLLTTFIASVAGAEPIRLEVWIGTGGPRDAVLEWIAEEFAAQNPGIVVEFIGVPDYNAKLTVAMLTGTGPDLIHAHPAFTPNPDGAHFLPLPADVFDLDELKSNLHPSAIEPWTWDGQLVGVQYAINPHVLFYNMDHFDEVGLDSNAPPRTWDEVRQYARRLLQRDENEVVTRSGMAVTRTQDGWAYQNHVLNAGGQILDARGNPSFANEIGFASLQRLYDLLYVDRVHNDAFPASLFLRGGISMFQLYSGYATRIPEDIRFGVAQIPVVVDDGQPSLFTTYGDWGFAVTRAVKGRGEEVEAAAWKLLQFLISTDVQVALLGFEGAPVLANVIEDPRTREWLAENPHFMTAVLQTGHYPGKVQDVNALIGIFNTMIDSALRKGVPVHQAVNEAAEQIALLQQAR